MKIILCIFLLNITAVSVFGQSVPLDGTLGQSVKFPAAVEKRAFLMYGTLPIGEVDSGKFKTSLNGKYRDRLQWDSSTGLFSLSGLKMEDSGEYKVQNIDQNIITVFQLNVHTVSVFGQSVELNGILGESVKFPAAVKKGGYLMYGTLTIGESSLGTPGIGNYKGRLHWDSSTGLFSLSGLREEDIGEYKVQNTDPNITRIFQLNVHKDNVPVSKPHVSITQNEYPCTLLCAVERGTGVTLSWYREDQKKPYFTSPVQSAPHLHLPVPVDEGGIYTCEAKNSVSNETSDPLTVGAHCTDSRTWIIVASVIAAVAVLIAVVFAFMYHRFERSRRAVRTLIQVKKLLDNVDPGAFGESMPPLSPDAVGSLIEVKKILDNVDPHEYAVGSLIEGFKIKRRAVKGRCNVKILPDNVDPHEYAVGSLIEVKKLLENMDPQAYDETMPALPPGDETFPPDDETFPPDAVGSLIKVKKILDNVDPHEYGFKRKCRGFQGRCKVKELFDNVDPGAYGDAVQAVPQSGPVDDLICFLQETKIVISSHQTEVPLNQATCEVGEP